MTPLAFSFLLSALPMLLTLAAIVDVVRTGAEWYWILLILYMPVIGPLVYFGSRARGGVGSAPSFEGLTLAQARRTLRERQSQLAHWRGPGPLAEAGESLLVLGRYAQAEAHLKEARERGAPIQDVGFALALALEAQRRAPEAIPILEELCLKEPDHRFGQARLALARALDAAGRTEDAERELRGLLEKRSLVEARVRLARLCFLRGAAAEGREILAALQADARTMPPFQRRRERRWLWAARALGPGRTRLPASPTGRVRDYRHALALVAGLASLALAAPLLLQQWLFLGELATSQRIAGHGVELARQLQALDATAPRLGTLAAADLDRYLRIRQGLAGALDRVPHAGDADPSLWSGTLSAALPVLTREGVGPSWLRQACAKVDWAFLGREEALPFALTPEEWVGWSSDRRLAAMTRHAIQNPQLGLDAEQARARLARRKTLAAERRALADAERGLLEERRGALEALDPGQLGALERLVFDPWR